MQIKTYTGLTLLVFSSAAFAWQPLTYPIRSQSPYQRSIDTAMCYATANKQTKVNIVREPQIPPRKPAATKTSSTGVPSRPPLPPSTFSSAPIGASMPAAARAGRERARRDYGGDGDEGCLGAHGGERDFGGHHDHGRHGGIGDERGQQRLGNGGCERGADGCGIQREAAASAGARAANDTVLGRVWRVHASAGLRRRTVTLLASLVTVPCFFLIVAPAFDAPLRHGDA